MPVLHKDQTTLARVDSPNKRHPAFAESRLHANVRCKDVTSPTRNHPIPGTFSELNLGWRKYQPPELSVDIQQLSGLDDEPQMQRN